MGVLDGLVVVELGAWVAGPSAAALLADWGAEVWKVEPPEGDPFRRIMASHGYRDVPNAPFLMDNRNKLSVALDLRADDDRAALEAMLERADVFITNTRTEALVRLGLDPDATVARHPRLVYGLVTGYGSVGPDRNRAGYDAGAFASRPGVLHQMRTPGQPPVPLPHGFGDHVVALAAAAGVLGALVERGTTGCGQVVETSLLRTGLYTLGWELGTQLMLGRVSGRDSREQSKAPMFNCYRSADDAWFFLLGVEGDRLFGPLTEAMGRPDLQADERFATARERRRHTEVLIRELDAEFARRPRAAWAELFDKHDVWWAPVQTPAEVVADPQVIAAGGFLTVDAEDGTTGQTVASPVDFRAHPCTTAMAAPEVGADTAEVLARVGFDRGTAMKLDEQVEERSR